MITNGELLLVEDKLTLMRKLGKKRLTIELRQPIHSLPASLSEYELTLADDGSEITYTYDIESERTGITTLLQRLRSEGVMMRDLNTTQSSLEEIFVNLVKAES